MTAKVIFLMGATATGKTDYAVELVTRYPFDIISVDSAMIYRGMDIGTAKPTPDILAHAPHRLIDLVDPCASYSVAEFCDQAMTEIKASHTRGRIPILVGGTMLYFRSIQNGLALLPAGDATVRAQIDAQAQQQGWAAMHQELTKIDPIAAARIHPNDPQRIQRALEVFRLSGKSLTEWLRAQQNNVFPFDTLKLALGPVERRDLDMPIHARFTRMLDAGFIDEVVNLRTRYDLHARMPSMRCVGYRQVWEYLEVGKTSTTAQSELIASGVKATQSLVKRQYTWMRAESDLHWLVQKPVGASVWDSGEKLIEKFLESP